MSKPDQKSLKMLRAGYTAEYINGYNAGLKDRARRERRSLRRIIHRAMAESNHEHCEVCWYLGEIVLEKLAARAKRKGRAG